MFNDIVNGFFELVGGLLCWLNVRKILVDKKIKGVYWPVQLFFAAWGWWNLYYYPSLFQWFSFFGGLFLVLGNTCWVFLAIKFTIKEKNNG
ncbi:MAG: hypothetical protein ABFD50_16410 [Smithella sp.]